VCGHRYKPICDSPARKGRLKFLSCPSLYSTEHETPICLAFPQAPISKPNSRALDAGSIFQ